MRWLVNAGSRLFPVDISSIAYFFSEDKITYLVLDDGKKYSIPYSLEQLEKRLDPHRFFRINRQMLLAVDAIRMVNLYFKGRLKLDVEPDPGWDVLVSGRRAGEFKDWLDA